MPERDLPWICWQSLFSSFQFLHVPRDLLCHPKHQTITVSKSKPLQSTPIRQTTAEPVPAKRTAARRTLAPHGYLRVQQVIKPNSFKPKDPMQQTLRAIQAANLFACSLSR